jgi:hypothetical protein
MKRFARNKLLGDLSFEFEAMVFDDGQRRWNDIRSILERLLKLQRLCRGIKGEPDTIPDGRLCGFGIVVKRRLTMSFRNRQLGAGDKRPIIFLLSDCTIHVPTHPGGDEPKGRACWNGLSDAPIGALRSMPAKSP